MNGEPIRPVPKPEPRAPKKPSRLRQISPARAARIAAGEEQPGMKRGGPMRRKGDTAYSNRERLTGKMLFVARVLPCAARAVEGAGPCIGDRQCAHLGDRKTNGGFRKCPDDECGCLCAEHHRLVDNPTGWSGREGFYLLMSPPERTAFRIAAMAAADEAWNELTDEQRDFWEDRAALEFARRGEARRAAR